MKSGSTMKTAGGSPSRGKPGLAGARIRKTMEIDRSKLAKARRILGSDSDTQTVDRALDIVIANQEIESAIEASFGSIPDFRAT
jgi:hypothetical protein